MDGLLCDELLYEIIQRLPPSSFAAVFLVCKRWLSAIRACTTNLSLSIPHLSLQHLSLPSPSLSKILSHYPNLSSLTILSNPFDDHGADALLLSVAAAPCASRLIQLRFVSLTSPVSSSALLSSSASLKNLTNLRLSIIFPLSFSWLSSFPSIKSLSFVFFPKSPTVLGACDVEGEDSVDLAEDYKNSSIVTLPLERLSISGVRAGDLGMSWIWQRCGNLRRLRLRACEGTGDGTSSPYFTLCLASLLVLELRGCRAIADRVLLRAADHCHDLTSLLIYDGGSSDALHYFISRRAASLNTIDLRLPLDLHNDHLSAIASVGKSNSPCLTTLRLQSCCLVTGDGLRAVGRAESGKAIEELALVNCDVLEREPGLLSFLGQSLPRLRRLDLSYNETLGDKELVAMLSSCASLVDIKLRGCSCLTDSLVVWLIECGRLRLEIADLSRCPGISVHGIEIFILNSSILSCVSVENEKISEIAMAMASRRKIQIGD
ncbi:F-box protein At1g47056 [Phalaenopsis equestris]|uniref:F-box protein At1g47056 n=1 Tax=Phalaenopsis equestris TaxID=78828 RepID=UPI0009E25E46|nr:F-box protein At1g47056 [Phalaenopsis equestris]